MSEWVSEWVSKWVIRHFPKTLNFGSIPGGELFERIVEEDYLMEDDAIYYVRQVLEALQYMHEKNIIHLDIKVGSWQGCWRVYW